MKSYPTPLPPNQSWPRSYLIHILEAALSAKEFTFARQTALAWLASYPGDLPVNLIHTKALVLGGLARQALPVLHNLVQADPEFCEAQLLLYESSQATGQQADEVAYHCAFALGGLSQSREPKKPDASNWGQILRMTRQELDKGAIKKAERNIQPILGLASHTPLSGITHLHVLRAQSDTPRQSLLSMAEHYHQRWPNCLQFMLMLAEVLMEGGESVRAVALLHRAASKDVTGQVATRLWGADHPYRNLWPNQMKALVSTQIPSSVAANMGWNLLSQPKMPPPTALDNQEVPSAEPSPPDVVPMEADFQQTQKETLETQTPTSRDNQQQTQSAETPTSLKPALKRETHRKVKPNSDGLFPVYVVFTTQKGLQKKFGVETTNILDEAMRRLVASLRKRLDWGAVLIYADDPISMAQYGLKPVPPDDPWKLKLALVDLNKALGDRGARIGALLIVGGPKVVPYHHLPNPTDDNDADVPSDNPYATQDENYFIPEWPVGRLPCGSGKDPGLLISTLRAMAEYHGRAQKKSPFNLFHLLQWIKLFFNNRRNRVRSSFGYSAEVWKEISSSIFRTIGDKRSLITSPPDEVHRKKLLPRTRLGYFNLHGVPDSAEWFGQRDPRKPSRGPDYPIALHPSDITNGGNAPQVIFTEACYGANILKKSVDDALALKFLSSGSQAVIGSTVISYGSVTPPLNAADLLGNAFWKYFKEGFSTGEALRRAKITLASEMHERQGYLDGEDQKTLISFVLYGDPLAQERDLKNWKFHKTLSRMNLPKEIKIVCDRVDVPGTSEPIPNEMIGHVKNIVEQYLPGMRDAQISLSHEHANCCSEGHICPTSQLGGKSRADLEPQRQVITLSKQKVRARYVHESYARVTLDKEGKMVKLTVSR